MEKLPYFRYWCQKIIPLVYDDSLSYYEILCKIVSYINNLIADNNQMIDEINSIKAELDTVQKWIDNFDTSYVEELIAKYIATMIFVEITQAGYIVYYIPQNWSDITFNTTGLDVTIPDVGYGHLVLSY